MLIHPSELPESADPIGSTRHQCTIWHIKTQDNDNRTFFYDQLFQGIFVIEEHDPQCENYKIDVFEGVVLKEANGNYAWWKTNIQKEKS